MDRAFSQYGGLSGSDATDGGSGQYGSHYGGGGGGGGQYGSHYGGGGGGGGGGQYGSQYGGHGGGGYGGGANGSREGVQVPGGIMITSAGSGSDGNGYDPQEYVGDAMDSSPDEGSMYLE